MANGGVVEDEDVRARQYSSSDLKPVRSVGFEKTTFVKGEPYLISVKERDPFAAEEKLKVGKQYVTTLTAATLEGFSFDATGQLATLEMRIKGARQTAPLLSVPKRKVRVGGDYIGVFPVKPYYERFAKLYQGQQLDEFHVDATAFHPESEGLLGMSISRVTVRKARGTVITNDQEGQNDQRGFNER